MATTKSRLHYSSLAIEWLAILAAIVLFSRATLLDFNPRQLQQTGEHNESATLPILAEIGLRRYGEIPLWNPYMLTGFPHAGDLINHFWNPVATIPVMLWGGINGMKVSVFLSLLVAAYGQWFLAHTFGLRGIFRLWGGLLFALSGGLLLLWRLGWYELLVGAAWFPWCFALLWQALHRRDRSSLVWAALAIAMVLTAGGGYYPFYLGISLIVLTVAALAFHKPTGRGIQLRRAAAVAVLSVGLAAVYLVPLVDGLRYTRRDAPPDVTQLNSQPIPYALFNYVVSDESWFITTALNRASGYGWFYIGVLPLLALAFTPWLFGRFSWRRRGILTLLSLLFVLLLWHANRNAPVRYLYEWLPFLYTFRFPNRLLIIAAIPLVVLAAITMQGLLVWLRRAFRGLRLSISSDADRRNESGIRLITFINLSAALLLLIAMVDVYRVNYRFGMHPNPRLAVAEETLGWLRLHDTGLYYVNIGGPTPYWNWVAHAYELEMPVFNFRYNRRVLSMDDQYQPESPFNAQPKYVILPTDQPMPEGATLVTTIRQMSVWYQPQALPYAFAVDPAVPIARDTVRELAVRLDGPNRVIVDGAADEPGQQLVALVSDYPGWRLAIDGRPATIVPVNGYLGAEMMAGEHTYTFEFRPVLFYAGLGISLLTLLLCVWLVSDEWRRARASTAQPY